jgi:seryl-tRNA synthetase
MLDRRALLADADNVVAKLETRGVDTETLTRLTDLLRQRSSAIQKTEALRHEQNEATKRVQTLRQSDPEGFEKARADLKGLKESIKSSEAEQNEVEAAVDDVLLGVPNLPDDSVPVGDDESANRLERTVGEAREFDFEAKAHWDLGESLGILDFERASKLSGSRFAVYRGLGARLEWALASFMLDVARERGFVETSVPLLVRDEAMIGAAQYPKFRGESFETLDNEYVLIPTSEVPLVNLHRDEILSGAELPLRYCAFTPCFRREAGAAGRDTRGLIRQHQFNKVELVAVTTPEQSDAELENLTTTAETVLQRLELPYRVMALATGDLGFAAAKTYDLEVWLPGQGAYREISSCSNCRDFQARRAHIRFRDQASGGKAKPQLAHTLNGSGVAVGRAFVAVLENYQQADGSVTIPFALRSYMGGVERIPAP